MRGRSEAKTAESVGVHTVMLRTGLVLGPGGGVLARMLPAFRAGVGGRFGDGRQWVSWIALDDLVAVILRALHDRRLGGAVNAVAPGAVRNAEFARTLARLLGRRALMPLPAFLLRTLLGPMADETLLASARAQPQRLREAGFEFKHATLEEALRAAIG